MEKELIKLGFKKKWLDDRSGYWFSYKIKYYDVKLEIYAEVDRKILLLQVNSGDYMSGKVTLDKYYSAIAKYKLTLENVKKLIKRYK